MIKIEKQGDHAHITINGYEEELFNDCRALINVVYKNTNFGKVFLDAWESVMKEREKEND